MTRITTWNMQGATNSMDSKWTIGVQQLLATDKVDSDVVCLQECGAAPPSSVGAIAPAWIGAPPFGLVTGYYTWKPSKVTYYIVWAQTDPNGNRVNIALASQVAPTNLLYAPPGLVGGRPAIGMLVGGKYVFSIHGFSGNGNDDPGLITNVNAMGLANWYVAGDYNREPSTWVPPYGVLCPPNKATYPSTKKKYDYMVKDTGLAVTGIVLDTFVVSDHYPVVFDV